MLVFTPSLADLPFRGNRNYLHSTDLYPALTEFAHQQFSADAFIESLTIRRAASHQPWVSFDISDEAFGSFCIRHSRNKTQGWLIESEAPIASRIPFDEVTAMRAAISGPGFALFKDLPPKYSSFELLIILTKIVSSQEGPGHWWLCRIDLSSPLLNVAPLECRLNRKTAGRFLTFKIRQAGRAIASITGISGAEI
ncbi:MAG TPA: hypothetical protein VLK33_06615 [Terriglobales bacterium]|nr:hypothetical protein [Terriglobales bacterium]